MIHLKFSGSSSFSSLTDFFCFSGVGLFGVRLGGIAVFGVDGLALKVYINVIINSSISLRGDCSILANRIQKKLFDGRVVRIALLRRADTCHQTGVRRGLIRSLTVLHKIRGQQDFRHWKIAPLTDAVRHLPVEKDAHLGFRCNMSRACRQSSHVRVGVAAQFDENVAIRDVAQKELDTGLIGLAADGLEGQQSGLKEDFLIIIGPCPTFKSCFGSSRRVRRIDRR